MIIMIMMIMMIINATQSNLATWVLSRDRAISYSSFIPSINEKIYGGKAYVDLVSRACRGDETRRAILRDLWWPAPLTPANHRTTFNLIALWETRVLP